MHDYDWRTYFRGRGTRIDPPPRLSDAFVTVLLASWGVQLMFCAAVMLEVVTDDSTVLLPNWYRAWGSNLDTDLVRAGLVFALAGSFLHRQSKLLVHPALFAVMGKFVTIAFVQLDSITLDGLSVPGEYLETLLAVVLLVFGMSTIITGGATLFAGAILGKRMLH